jgi:hypothetical protein
MKMQTHHIRAECKNLKLLHMPQLFSLFQHLYINPESQGAEKILQVYRGCMSNIR